jgi:serine/threonine protein kinase/Leucine-rich repeat (LRR) protein
MHVPLTEVVLRRAGVELVRVTLPPGDYVIGRSPEADIHADTEVISRKHALLRINYDHLLIEDLGSSNGTFVADQSITDATRIYPNQNIRLGHDATLEVRRERAPSALDVSLPPAQAAIRHFLPQEILAEKRYAIGGEIARGGMGTVLDARQNATQRTVAMKVMLGSGDEADVLRFIEEAQVTAQLDHPNIVPIYELGVNEQDQVFYTMKLVRGITLKKVLELLDQGVESAVKKYPLPALLTVFQKVCDAVAFAHSKGVIHRDLKPENIMLGDYGSVLLMDWGLAKVLAKKDRATPAESFVGSTRATMADTGGTMHGTVIGTPQYMAPEQARGEVDTLDQRVDIYTLGAVLFHLLYLRPPVAGGDPWEVVAKAAQGALDWTAPRRPAPESLAAVCRKALAFEREARYPSVAELQADITAYQNGFPTSAEQKSAWKQFTLFIRRHRAVSTSMGGALVLLAVISAAFAWKIVGERNRANAALAELRGTAPTFYSEAILLTNQEELDEALAKIAIALNLDPDNADYHAERGNILQSMERFAEAASEYAQAEKLDPKEPHAAENVALSRALTAAQKKNGEISVDQRMKWRDALEEQGRDEEAILAGRGINAGAQRMLPAWQAKIDAWVGKDAARVTAAGHGLHLNLANLSIVDLSPLRGMPLVSVDVSKNPHLTDLGPLAASPLESFYAQDASELENLSPLKRKRLRVIDIRGTSVRDLSPLTGMPLQTVFLDGAGISDLTPLRGSRLTFLFLNGTKVIDLSPLAGQPLEHLDMAGTQVSSLDPVGNAPISYLRIDCPFDLASLRAHRLRTLYVLGGMFDHPEELAKMTDLEVVVLPPAFNDPGPLRNLPYLRKIDFSENAGTPVEQLKDAADFFRIYDAPEVRAVRAALVKCGLHSVPLRNVNVNSSGRLCVDLGRMSIGNLASLHGLPINELDIQGNPATDIEPLRGMPLDTLCLAFTKVADLAPVRGMPLVRIRLHGSLVHDVSPLADCPQLESIELPVGATNIENLRALKRLHYLSETWDSAANHPAQTAVEFWKQYDAKRAAGAH